MGLWSVPMLVAAKLLRLLRVRLSPVLSPLLSAVALASGLVVVGEGNSHWPRAPSAGPMFRLLERDDIKSVRIRHFQSSWRIPAV